MRVRREMEESQLLRLHQERLVHRPLQGEGMRETEKKDLLEAIRVLEQYQAVYEDRQEVYADIASALSSMKADFERVLEHADKGTKD